MMFVHLVLVLGQHHIDPWRGLKQLLDQWAFTKDFAVSVGNVSHGKMFEYTKGKFTMGTRVSTASTSKWPMAMALLGLVNDGTIASLDDPCSKYVPWWTSDPRDNRSHVTFRHLLSFTSGFGEGHPGEENTTATCMDTPTPDDFDRCANEIYHTVNQTGTPGTTFSYNSVHLQLAGAVAMHASNLTIAGVLERYLFKAYGMSSTTCEYPSRSNPQLAVCLQTTGRDYERFLAATLSASVLSPSLIAESERDYTPFMHGGYQLYGTYAFGHFIECFDSPAGFTAKCAAQQTHIDPGAFGYFPLIDRRRNYYMQIVAYEHGEREPYSGIPEYLRFVVKPIVDAILADEADVRSMMASHAYPGLSLADVNYIMSCYVDPSSCK